MTYRTTKIPVFYFTQIENYLSTTDAFVSVSEFIRESVKEKLFRIQNEEVQKRYFLLIKDVVFNEEIIKKIHKKIEQISIEQINILQYFSSDGFF